MRIARALPIGLALALAPARASAESPRVSLRLDYTLGKGGESCPADPAALRGEVEKRMGYDPFDRPAARERLAVVLVRKGGGYAATVERFNAAGVSTWTETFPSDPFRECAALISPLASFLRSMFLGYQGAPAAPAAPAAPPPEPDAPAPTPPPAPPPELRAPLPEPAKPPELPNVPNHAYTTARTVAIVFCSTGVILLGFGVAFAIDAQSKGKTANALAAKPFAGGTWACANGQAPSGYCSDLRKAVQSQDSAIGARNGLFIGAGVSAAVGAVATFWALSLPSTIKGPQTQVSLRPGGLVIHGSF